LVFKGGTSLSKAYGVIRRFSEDVDLTYDIRDIAPDLETDTETPLPSSKSQERTWTREIRSRLREWVETEVVPRLAEELSARGLPAKARADGDKVFVDYEPASKGTGYVLPSVMLEFGARSTGEPAELRPVACDAAAYVSGMDFPTATPRVMLAERTFWEKATAIHVFCAQGHFRGADRFARHWHDLVRLDAAGIADRAIANREIAHAVAKHKSAFFAEKDSAGNLINYHDAVTGALHLVPSDGALAKLTADYEHMIADRLFLGDVESMAALMEKCKVIEQKANARRD
jgi:hypothetical protein